MTAQLSDSFILRGETYAIAGVNGDGLFDPTTHDLQPTMLSTACWRGFLCTYTVAQDGLMLTRLAIGITEPGTGGRLTGDGPERFGVRPRYDQWEGHVYEPITEPVAFTGGLLIARDFIRDLYVHMGFHPAWKYREVHELLFEDGRLQTSDDRSDAIAEIRDQQLAAAPLNPDARDSEKVATWIERTFSLSYYHQW